MSIVYAPVSLGELYDKICILKIKSERIADHQKLANVMAELELLLGVAEAVPVADPEHLNRLLLDLKTVNEAIWDAEDLVREFEREGRFGDEFVRLARSTYGNNDKRAAIKREINLSLGSQLVEEKSHKRGPKRD